MRSYRVFGLLSACQAALALNQTSELTKTQVVVTTHIKVATVTENTTIKVASTQRKEVSQVPVAASPAPVSPAPANPAPQEAGAFGGAPANRVVASTGIAGAPAAAGAPPAPTASIAVGAGLVPIAAAAGSGVVIDGSAPILPGGSGSINGIAVSLLPDAASLVIGTSTIANPVAVFATLTPGGAPAAGLPAAAGNFRPSAGLPGAGAGGFPAAAGGIPAMITNGIPGFMIAGQQLQQVGGLQIGSQILLPGSTLVVANTTMILPTAMPSNASIVIINNQTSTLPFLQRQIAEPTDLSSISAAPTACNPAAAAGVTEPPVLVINGKSFKATMTDSSLYYPISPGQTITPGQAFSFNGYQVSLDAANTALQVGSSQYTLAPAVTWAPVRAGVDMGSGAGRLSVVGGGLLSVEGLVAVLMVVAWFV